MVHCIIVFLRCTRSYKHKLFNTFQESYLLVKNSSIELKHRIVLNEKENCNEDNMNNNSAQAHIFECESVNVRVFIRRKLLYSINNKIEGKLKVFVTV